MGTSLRDSAFRRIALVAGATSAVMIVLLLARPFYSGPGGAIGSAGVEITQTAHDTKFETVSFAASPTLDVSPQFFFGAGDGSNGYYAERPASRP